VATSTADLIVQGIYRGPLRLRAGLAQMRNAAEVVILGLGVATLLWCLVHMSTPGALLYFMGAPIASTIWPKSPRRRWHDDRIHRVAVCPGEYQGRVCRRFARAAAADVVPWPE
jgi:hypothetical protein